MKPPTRKKLIGRARLDPKRPGKLLPNEHQIQAAYFDWVRLTYPGCKLIYAVPNGANKSPAARMKFMREGQIPGMPDVNIDIQRQGRPGMRIEVKSAKGLLSKDQIEAIKQLDKAGYETWVCHSTDEMIRMTEIYLGDWKC